MKLSKKHRSRIAVFTGIFLFLLVVAGFLISFRETDPLCGPGLFHGRRTRRKGGYFLNHAFDRNASPCLFSSELTECISA